MTILKHNQGWKEGVGDCFLKVMKHHSRKLTSPAPLAASGTLVLVERGPSWRPRELLIFLFFLYQFKLINTSSLRGAGGGGGELIARDQTAAGHVHFEFQNPNRVQREL